MDSLTCVYTLNYHNLPTTGQLSIDLSRADPTAGQPHTTFAEDLDDQADQDLRDICLAAPATATQVPGTSTAKRCARSYTDGIEVGLSATTETEAVTVGVGADYHRLDHARVDAFLNELAMRTLTKALANLQGR
jgi:hypothetical protein